MSCHVVEPGEVLAAPVAVGAQDREAPHKLRRTAAFGGDGACVGCHEFRFPMMTGDEDGAFMQTTVREHQRSPRASESCASCHMPGAPRDHSFAQVRDPDWLRQHLRAEATWSDGAVHITLTQPAPGHGFPTGDLFRRLEVGAELRDARGRVQQRTARALARRFELEPGRPGRQLTADTRVFDRPVTVDLELELPPGASRHEVIWWVTYQRVATVGLGQDFRKATIESEEKLHSGRLTPGAGTTP